jgi:hypothetical protein
MKTMQKKDGGLVLLGTAAILALPLLGMQFSAEVNWSAADFALMGALLIGTGCLLALVARNVATPRYRMLAGAGLVLALLLVWAELAVGVIGTPFAGS